MKVVVNTTPLISLACVGRLDLFEQLFGGVILAEAVYREIKAKPGYGYAEIDQPWIDIRPIAGDLYRPLLLTQLDAGEAETIILAREIHADYVVIDENRGYRLAQQAGLPVVRTLSLLLRAKEKGFITQIKPIMEKMVTRGRWYSPSVCQALLVQAGEI
ncbi:DUF3368 domain-containing protein [Lamprobacter modestohalophilus]|uniref:DUF3368 domain-containing protein n=1 Tax=Lamprobacter modestohalophilus TaxID=1064514 RepID=UPI002ADEF141|nr:DUF3368 domain-containing protein [Lamprobacter modestohalophilus]MEA1052947.1 DUF3368 domain-containing protein [Lamprobacter modestohalophilus]